MNLSKESIKVTTEYIGKILEIIFPGMMLLDTVYERGLFSLAPKTIYEFLLLLVWAIMLSVPYVFLTYLAVDLTGLAKKRGLKVKEGDEAKAAEAYLNLPALLLFSLVTYLLFRLSGHVMPRIPSIVFGIPVIHVRLFVSFVVTIPVAFLIGFFYRWWVLAIANKVLNDEPNKPDASDDK